jgi:hypothetical protein
VALPCCQHHSIASCQRLLLLLMMMMSSVLVMCLGCCCSAASCDAPLLTALHCLVLLSQPNEHVNGSQAAEATNATSQMHGVQPHLDENGW